MKLTRYKCKDKIIETNPLWCNLHVPRNKGNTLQKIISSSGSHIVESKMYPHVAQSLRFSPVFLYIDELLVKIQG